MPDPALLLSRTEAARFCGVGLTTFKRWTRAGIVRPVEVPLVNRRLFRRSDLETFCQRLPQA